MTYLLDTNAIIYLLSGKAIWRPEPDALLMTSIVSHIELLGWAKLSPDEDASIRRFLQRVTTCQITEDILEPAISLRKLHHLKTIDSIVAATCMREGAVLVTNDRQLLKLGIVQCLPITAN